MAARERRERDLLIQQQRFIRELDTDVCASVRRMEIRVISLRWVLETRPTQMLRRQELEVLDANCSRRAPGIARPFMPAELAAVALRRSERRILVLSLPWLQEDNPDPLGFRASQIIAFAERFARRLGIRDDPERSRSTASSKRTAVCFSTHAPRGRRRSSNAPSTRCPLSTRARWAPRFASSTRYPKIHLQ